MLSEFVADNRDEIVRRCSARGARRVTTAAVDAEIDRGIPLLLDQLVDALHRGHTSSPEIVHSARVHGHDLLRRGFSVSDVVHNYGDVCQSITELALERSAPISTHDFRMLNGCLDDAIAGAVTQYGREQQQSAAEGDTLRENEQLGFFAHELRNLINTAVIAFDVVRSGNVGVAGSTGAVLRRSLVGAGDLIARSLAEVRLTQGVQHVERFLVSSFIDELAPAATMAATALGVTLIIHPVATAIAIEGDRQVLTAVVMNVLQNAFKFTRHLTTVRLRVVAQVDRVLIEVEDECGGLPPGDADGLFRPFEQRNANRAGLGLGLAFSRWATEANRGRIYARDLRGVGCVFTVDLPRMPVPAPTIT
jgi:signal transduction histidine kinase